MADQKYLVGYTGGYTTRGKLTTVPVYVEITFSNGRLSLMGNIGNDSFGQISKPGFTSYGPGWNEKDADHLWAIWDRWHLNDMRPGCVHQRAEYDIYQKVIVHKYGWTRDYGKMRQQAERGEMDAEAYEEYKVYAQLVKGATLGLNSPKYPSHPTIEDALKRGLIEEKGTEEKIANQVDYREHPDGLLSKPCRKCGYKYGSAWLFEEVPAEVIEWLNMKAAEVDAASETMKTAIKALES